jgi:Tfp pilus assembly protein PilN
MSTAVKEKKPFLPQRKVPTQASGGAVAVRGASVGRPVGYVPLTVGGEPRVHLLPHEVTERKKAREVRRRLLLVAAVVVVLVIAAYGIATLSLSAAQAQLAGAQTTTAQLLAQQSKYGAVTKVNSDIDSIEQSQKTATAQEILWPDTLASIEADLPAGASITAASLVVDSPLGAPAGSPATSVPLEGPHIATVNFSILIQQGDIPGFLNTLPSLKGFVDATPNSITASGAGPSMYLLAVTVHLNSDATSNRFTKAEASK